MAKTFSGKQMIKILCKKFSFVFVSQNGSHVKLEKYHSNRTISTIVPLHSELFIGTFRTILKKAEIDVHDFFDKI